MNDSPKVSITVKAGSDHGSPWVVFHAGSVDEAGFLIQEMLAKDVFSKVRQVSDQFAGGVSTQQAVQAIQNTFPGAQVVQSDDVWAGTNAQPQYQQQQPPGGWAAGAQPAPQQPPAQQLPQGQGVPCGVCGGPTQYKAGTSKSGKQYRGHFCLSNRDHAPVWG